MNVGDVVFYPRIQGKVRITGKDGDSLVVECGQGNTYRTDTSAVRPLKRVAVDEQRPPVIRTGSLEDLDEAE